MSAMIDFMQQRSDVTSLTGIRTETLLPNIASSIPTTSEQITFLPAGVALPTRMNYVTSGNSVRRINNRILTIPKLATDNINPESWRIKEARRLLADAQECQPKPGELVWMVRTIPPAIVGKFNHFKHEALSAQSLIYYIKAINLVGMEMLATQVSSQLMNGNHVHNLKEISEGLWILYRGETIKFQKTKSLREKGWEFPIIEMHGVGHDIIDEKYDITAGGAGAEARNSQGFMLALYLHFLQDPKYNALWHGYKAWVDGHKTSKGEWKKLRAKIMKEFAEKGGRSGVDYTAKGNAFIRALAAVDFSLLIGLSPVLMKYAVHLTGVAMESLTNFQIQSDPSSAETMVRVIDGGRQYVTPLAVPMPGRFIYTKYVRPDMFSMFDITFVADQKNVDVVNNLHPSYYGENGQGRENVEVYTGEGIYEDAWEGPYLSPVKEEEIALMLSFPHINLSPMDENKTRLERRKAYETSRKIAVKLHRSIHTIN